MKNIPGRSSVQEEIVVSVAQGHEEVTCSGIVGKELMNGRVAGEMTEPRKEARRAPRAANRIGTVTRTKEAREKVRARAKASVKPDTATTAESRCTSEQTVHSSGPTALMKKTIKHRRGGASLKEKMPKNSRAWRRLTKKETGAGLRRAESPGGEGKLTRDQHSTSSLKTMKVSKRPED